MIALVPRRPGAMGPAALALAAFLALAPGLPAAAAEPPSGYASVNALEMYYEVHGTGRPMVTAFLDAHAPEALVPEAE